MPTLTCPIFARGGGEKVVIETQEVMRVKKWSDHGPEAREETHQRPYPCCCGGGAAVRRIWHGQLDPARAVVARAHKALPNRVAG